MKKKFAATVHCRENIFFLSDIQMKFNAFSRESNEKLLLKID